MFQVLALTGLYLPPRAQMTQADWKDVHCHGDSECHVMKTKALAPELQVIFRNALQRVGRQRSAATDNSALLRLFEDSLRVRGCSGEASRGHCGAREVTRLTWCVSRWQGQRSLVVRMGPPDNVSARPTFPVCPHLHGPCVRLCVDASTRND